MAERPLSLVEAAKVWLRRKRWYLAGSEVDFSDVDQLTRILQTHSIDKKGFQVFSHLQSALELRETHAGLFDVFLHSTGDIEELITGVQLPDIPLTPHTLFSLRKDTRGCHQIGGEPPVSLQMPSCPEMRTSFQYLGFIDGADQQLSWVDTSQLHLIYPVYECNFGVFLDWTDPLRPRVLNPETFDPAWWDASQSGWDSVIFQPTRYTTCSPCHATDSCAHVLGGVPLWLQAPEIPVCPVTGETMRFVCQLSSDEEISVVPGKEGEHLPFADRYLCFGDCGYLYVFYHPRSRVMHLHAQW